VRQHPVSDLEFKRNSADNQRFWIRVRETNIRLTSRHTECAEYSASLRGCHLNAQMVIALLFAATTILLGLWSGRFQLRAQRELRERKHVPSDEFAFLRGRYRRRLAVSVLFVLVGVMLAGWYLSGMEGRVDAMGEKQPTDPEGEKKEMTPEQKQLMRMWAGFWTTVSLLVLMLIGFAIHDGLATRRYWLKIYREMREEHNSQLRRDLAVYKQQKDQQRGGENFGGRLGQN
jgi:hypothetical protein